jgi:hypothetical protein
LGTKECKKGAKKGESFNSQVNIKAKTFPNDHKVYFVHESVLKTKLGPVVH